MSYNYLPLDRKCLIFQQVKNLLDYDQLVSITFDAHERILQCREYLDITTDEKITANKLSDTSAVEMIRENALATGKEVPIDVVKLMLMLKIKSLSYGHGGVDIETVKRLMVMYNKQVLPVIHSQPASTNSFNAALGELVQPLVGLGEVYYNSQKRKSQDIFDELGLPLLSVQKDEVPSLLTGTHFVTAYGLYILKKSEQLLKFADALAALSFHAIGCSIASSDSNMSKLRAQEGRMKSSAAILHYLGGDTLGFEKNEIDDLPVSTTITPQVHGAAIDTLGCILELFLDEVNSVSENPVVLPDEGQIVNEGTVSAQPLLVALDSLAISMATIANISERRMYQLAKKNVSVGAASRMATGIINDNKIFLMPASVDYMMVSDIYDIVIESTSATNCLSVITNVEKVLALELVAATKLSKTNFVNSSSKFLKQFVDEATQQVSVRDEDCFTTENITKAIDFIYSRKL